MMQPMPRITGCTLTFRGFSELSMRVRSIFTHQFTFSIKQSLARKRLHCQWPARFCSSRYSGISFR